MSSVMRQKGESQNGGNKKVKHAKFSKKRTFLTPWYAHVQGVRNIRFSGNLACFVFLKQSFWDSPFRRITNGVQFYTSNVLNHLINHLTSINWFSFSDSTSLLLCTNQVCNLKIRNLKRVWNTYKKKIWFSCI